MGRAQGQGAAAPDGFTGVFRRRRGVKRPEDERVFLIMSTSSSKCGACGKAATPSEERHLTVPGRDVGARGCGVTWTHLTVDTIRPGLDEAVQSQRPDLQFVPISMPPPRRA
jgi:hypothetical protein